MSWETRLRVRVFWGDGEYGDAEIAERLRHPGQIRLGQDQLAETDLDRYLPDRTGTEGSSLSGSDIAACDAGLSC